jgi:hypothetical protein
MSLYGGLLNNEPELGVVRAGLIPWKKEVGLSARELKTRLQP